MKKLLIILLWASQTLAQPWSPSGTCDFTDQQQWNNGGAKGCACTWRSIENGEVTLNCAFGDCGQNALYECVYDCNGHNGYATDMIPRQCDGTANPLCWYNGSGSAGELYCQGIALPVEFLELKGFPQGSTNVIKWSTASEYNVSHFIVERSLDGLTFEYVATLLASGFTTLESHYRVIDLAPNNGITYYKLIEYDFDGYIEVLGVIAIENIPRSIIQTTDMMGRDVDPEVYKGVMIELYDDGSKALKYN